MICIPAQEMCWKNSWLPVKDDTTFTKIFTKIEIRKKLSIWIYWDYVITVWHYFEIRTILNKSKLSQKRRSIIARTRKVFQKHSKDAYKNCTPAKKIITQKQQTNISKCSQRIFGLIIFLFISQDIVFKRVWKVMNI